MKCEYLQGRARRRGEPYLVRATCPGNGRRTAYPIYVCALHGRCLPTLVPSAELLAQRESGVIESDLQLYRWCHGCQDYAAKNSARA